MNTNSRSCAITKTGRFGRLSETMSAASSRTTMWLFASQLLAAGVSLIVNVLASYSLAPDQRGYLAFFLQLAYFLTVLMMLGVEKPYVTHVRTAWGDAIKDILRLVRPGWWMIFAVMAASAVYLLQGANSVATALGLMCLFMMTNVHVRVTRSAYISSGRWRPFVFTSVGIQSLTLLSALVLTVGQAADSNWWLGCYAVAGLLASLVVMRTRKTALSPALTQEAHSKIRRQGLELIPASLGNTAMLRSDRLILPLLAGPEALGIYILVAASLEMTVWPIQQWADAKLSDWKHRLDQDQHVPVFRTMLLSAAGIAVLCIFMSALLVALVCFVLPAAYAESLSLLAPLSAASIVYGMTRVQQGVTIAKGQGKIVSAAEVVGMIASVALYLMLIPLWGAFGAAIGSTLGYCVCLVTTWIGTRRRG